MELVVLLEHDLETIDTMKAESVIINLELEQNAYCFASHIDHCHNDKKYLRWIYFSALTFKLRLSTQIIVVKLQVMWLKFNVYKWSMQYFA